MPDPHTSGIPAKQGEGFNRAINRGSIRPNTTPTMVKAASKKAKRTRPRRKPNEGPVHYVMRIESWDWSYSLGINVTYDRSDLYSDHRHLHLTGKLLRPSTVKAHTVQLAILPDALFNRDQWHRHKDAHVGSLQLYRGQLDGLFSMPSDVLPSLLTMLAADKFRFVSITAPKLHYGRAVVQRYSLDMNHDEDELPPDS